MGAACVEGRGRRVVRGCRPRHGSRGFTLVELAVATIIVGLLLGALLTPLATQLELRRHRTTHTQLREIKDALAGFALANHNRLPCPDIDGDGREDLPDPAPTFCADVEGFLPWATLGVAGLDAWGRPMRYLAESRYSAAGGVPNPPDTSCCLSVQDRDGSILVGDVEAPGDNGPAAIVYSCGKNGVPDGDNDKDGVANTGADCTNPGEFDGAYVQGVFTEGVFDDLLIWLSRHVLLSRLVAGETWPP